MTATINGRTYEMKRDDLSGFPLVCKNLADNGWEPAYYVGTSQAEGRKQERYGIFVRSPTTGEFRRAY